MFDEQTIASLRDKKWRMNHLYSVINKAGIKTRFEMNREQEALFDSLAGHKRHIILKARQLGFTTLIAIHFLDEILFNRNKHALIVTHGLDESKKIMIGKIHFAYDNLAPELQKLAPIGYRNTEKIEIKHSNNDTSSIEVSTSGRSGTYQMLHVSEFGKICARFPEKAKEIISGAIPAAEQGQQFIESTAEGQAGAFYEMSTTAEQKRLSGDALHPFDYQFHFVPWWSNPEYVSSQAVIFEKQFVDYFEALETRGISLTPEQKYWYVATAATLKRDMKREHPSFSQEAFEVAVEGAVYGLEMEAVDKERRIMDIPLDKSVPVYAAWDIGQRDSTTCVFFQVKPSGYIDFIDCFEDCQKDEYHYKSLLDAKGYNVKAHYFPHDADNVTGWNSKSTKQLAEAVGIRPITVLPRANSELAEISFVRQKFSQVRFDRVKTVDMVKALRHFHFQWLEKRGDWSELPYSDWSNHFADALRYAIIALPKDVAQAARIGEPQRRVHGKDVNNMRRFV